MIFLHHITFSIYDLLAFLEKISGLISGLILIGIFYLERKRNKKDRINESLVNWYLKVLIDRNLEKIDLFFSSIEDSFIKELKSSQKNLFLEDEDVVFDLKLNYIEKFDDLKENFNIQFLILVSSLDTDFYTECLNKINEVEDNVKVHIDNAFSDEKSDFTRQRISELRAEFYSILYKPIEKIHLK